MRYSDLMNSLHPDTVLRAAETLDSIAHRTPIFTSRTLDDRFGAKFFFKGEHLQRCGAFKFRGAYYAISRLNPDERARGVITFSSGNHASGMALGGALLGAPVTVAMPTNTAPIKRKAAAGYGAELVDCEASEREAVGERIAKERGLTVIPPYDHDDVIAGQGTAALELLEDQPDLDLLLTPLGGGGLLAGTCLAAQAGIGEGPPPNVIGVEPEVADDGARSFHSGRIVRLETVPETIADGLRTRYVGERNFAVFSQRLTDVVTVSEAAIGSALAHLWLRMKLLTEPSAAVPLAAILEGKIDVRGRRVGIILSGGNCDPRAAAELIDRAVSL